MVLIYRSDDYAGRVAVVTGGSRGEGAAISRLLAARGGAVAVCSRDEAAVAAVVGEIRAGSGMAIGVAADCTDFAAIERLWRRVEEAFGPADILVALAAGFRRGGREGEDLQITVAANLTATFLTVKSFLPGMVERRRGTILTLPSVAVFVRHVARSVREYGVQVDPATDCDPRSWIDDNQPNLALSLTVGHEALFSGAFDGGMQQ